MRIITILFLMATSHAATSNDEVGTVGENLKKLGTSISREAETLTEKAKVKSEDFSTRLSHAVNELGRGFNRAWTRLKGEEPERH